MTKNNKLYISTKTVSCAGSSAKSAHPKIYLNLSPTGKAVCPYCGLEYTYKENKKAS